MGDYMRAGKVTTKLEPYVRRGICIDRDLLERAGAIARARGASVNAIIIEGVRLRVQRRGERRREKVTAT